MPPLTNIFGSDDETPFEPGSYLPLQPLDGDEDAEAPPADPLLGTGNDGGDLPPADG